MAAILNSAILNSTILDSSILVLPLKHTHTCQDWFSPFAQKKTSLTLPSLPFAQKNFTHSFWLNLMMVAILNSAILNSCQLQIQLLYCGYKTPCFLLSDSLKNTLPLLWLWLKLIQSDSNSFILTQLDDGNHIEFCHLEFSHFGFSHLSFSFQTHSYLPSLVPTICTKNFTHSFWLNLMMVAILNSAILNSASFRFSFCIVDIRHLVFFSQIHSKTLSFHSDSDSN